MALPYIDHGLEEPAVRAMVNAMIEEEKRTFQPPLQSYLDRFPLPELAKAPGVAAPPAKTDVLDSKRLDLPQPEGSSDLQAWRQSVDNARAQLQHQSMRLDNLELLTRYGGQAWTRHNDQVSQLVESIRARVHKARAAIEAINEDRQAQQLKAGKELLELETQWGELVSKNFEIEYACALLSAETAQYEDQLEALQKAQ